MRKIIAFTGVFIAMSFMACEKNEYNYIGVNLRDTITLSDDTLEKNTEYITSTGYGNKSVNKY